MAVARTKKARALSAPADLDEEAALGAAVNAYQHGYGSPQERVGDIISAWITERSRRWADSRGAPNTEMLAFGLGDAKLRGVIEACLPSIGEALTDLPPDVPLFDLDKAQVVDVFASACAIIREAMLRVNETPGQVLDDPLPF